VSGRRGRIAVGPARGTWSPRDAASRPAPPRYLPGGPDGHATTPLLGGTGPGSGRHDGCALPVPALVFAGQPARVPGDGDRRMRPASAVRATNIPSGKRFLTSQRQPICVCRRNRRVWLFGEPLVEHQAEVLLVVDARGAAQGAVLRSGGDLLLVPAPSRVRDSGRGRALCWLGWRSKPG
jgi:hypothetical protein